MHQKANMFEVILLFAFMQICFCGCPNGAETSFTNPNDCYIFVTDKSKFINAEGYCIQKGGHLTSVSNAFDNLFLSQKASLYFVDSTDADFWIGGTNELTPGNWSWLDGRPFVFSDWMKGQPANTTASSCATSSISTSLWTAVDCFQNKSFVCLIPAPTITTKDCESGWDLFETTGFCYKSWDGIYTWEEAESVCMKHNSHLVSIHSQIESDYIADLVRTNVSIVKDSCYNNQVWIGLFTVTNEDSWIWTDGTTFNFAGWSPGEPNGGQNCVELMLNSCGGDDMNYWNDMPCASNLKYLVCKKPKI